MKEIKLVIRIPELKLSKLKNFVWNKFKYLKIQIIKALKRGKRDIINKKIYTALLVIILGLLVWKFSLESAILWTIFLAFLFYGWEDRILAGIALAFLVSCPIFLIAERKVIAEQAAIYAYYFLVMTVALQIAKLCGLNRRIRLHI